MIAIGFFLLVILITVIITVVASLRTLSADDFYIAGGKVGGFSNGLAIAGDFMSAATLLGISAIVFNAGFDAAIYLGAPLAAFAIMIFLMTDKLQRLGRYTFTDIVAARLKERPIRVLVAVTTLAFSIMYLMVQVVGAGALIQVLFGIEYRWAVLLVTALMVLYVAVGGMIATTWVQITKAVMLLIGVTVLSILSLAAFNFEFTSLYVAANQKFTGGAHVMAPGGLNLTALSAVSLGLSLCFGLAGSPHLLMRFFTVPSAQAARQSAGVALGAVAFVNLLLFFVIGIAAVAIVKDNPTYLDAHGGIAGGTNMVSIHLAQAVGGDVFFGIMAAIAFATILAVVAGLTLASVSALTHDLYAKVLKEGDVEEAAQLRVSRFATLAIGALVSILGVLFEGQNIAYLVSLALTIAASTNFPLLMLSMYWSGLTTRGAIWGGTLGLLLSIVLILLGPGVWVSVLGFSVPLVSEAYPAIYSIVPAFITMWVVSALDGSVQGSIDRQRFVTVVAAHG